MATLTAETSSRRERIRASFSPSERRLHGMLGFIGFLHVLSGVTTLFAAPRRDTFT